MSQTLNEQIKEIIAKVRDLGLGTTKALNQIENLVDADMEQEAA